MNFGNLIKISVVKEIGKRCTQYRSVNHDCGSSTHDSLYIESDKKKKFISYPTEVEKQVNIQITNELQASHSYLSLANWFAAKKFYHGFAAMSAEERSHAMSLIGYQNQRGGFVVFSTINKPDIVSVGSKDVKTSLQFALDLELKNFNELEQLHKVAMENDDVITMEFITSSFLRDQSKSIEFIRDIFNQINADSSIITEYLINCELKKNFVGGSFKDINILVS